MGAQMKYPSDFLEAVDSMENGFPAATEEALDAAGNVILPMMKSRLEGAIENADDRSTGQLVEALGVAPVKLDRNGRYNTKVGFREPRRDGGINAKIANVIEYGSSTRAAKPFLKPTRRAARKPAIDAMRKVFEQWVRDITK